MSLLPETKLALFNEALGEKSPGMFLVRTPSLEQWVKLGLAIEKQYPNGAWLVLFPVKAQESGGEQE